MTYNPNAAQAFSPIFTAWDNITGLPLAGGQLYTYISGTTTTQNVYTDNTLTVPLSQPIILDNYGQAVFWMSTSPYRFNLLSASGVQQAHYPIDNISPQNAAFVNALSSTTAGSPGASLVGYISKATGASGTTEYEVNNRTVWLQDFNPAVDNTGITDATSVFQAASTWAISQTNPVKIKVKYGTYKVSGSNFMTIASNNVWDFEDVTINWTGTGSQAGIYVQANASDWGITGRLNLVGTGPGGAGYVLGTTGSLYGIYFVGGQRWLMENVSVKQITGYGFYMDTGGSFTAPRGEQGRTKNCSALNCWTGLTLIGNGTNEYTTWENFNTSGNGNWGIIDGTGNTIFIGGTCVDNLNGFQVAGSPYSNSAHGIVSGMEINHNNSSITGTYNILCQSVLNGYTFSACHIYGDSTTSGIVHLAGSQGVLFDSCLMDCPIVADGTAAINTIQNSYFDNSSGHGVSYCHTVTGANYSYVVFKNNFNATGPDIMNDVSFAYVLEGYSSPQTFTSGSSFNTAIFNSKLSDLRGNYNNSTGIYTCPLPGVYRVRCNLIAIGASVPVGMGKIVKTHSSTPTDITWAGFSALGTAEAATSACYIFSDVICVSGDTLQIQFAAQATGTPEIYNGPSNLTIELKDARTS